MAVPPQPMAKRTEQGAGGSASRSRSFCQPPRVTWGSMRPWRRAPEQRRTGAPGRVISRPPAGGWVRSGCRGIRLMAAHDGGGPDHGAEASSRARFASAGWSTSPPGSGQPSVATAAPAPRTEVAATCSLPSLPPGVYAQPPTCRRSVRRPPMCTGWCPGPQLAHLLWHQAGFGQPPVPGQNRGRSSTPSPPPLRPNTAGR